MAGDQGIKLDAYDVKILSTLQRNGRITKIKLAEEIGLSPSPCWERMRRLESQGLIHGYHAEIDIDQLLHTSTILVEVTLRSHQARDFERFEHAVLEVPEIVECYSTGGGIDYLLKVVALDIDHYQRIIDNLLMAEIGIDRYFTYIVTKPIKRDGSLPLVELLRYAGDPRTPR